MTKSRIEISVDEQTLKMIRACAEWRGIGVEDLARAYVEDWLDIDFPASQGRQTRRGIHRDGPITLDEETRSRTSSSWRDEFGISRLQPHTDQ